MARKKNNDLPKAQFGFGGKMLKALKQAKELDKLKSLGKHAEAKALKNSWVHARKAIPAGYRQVQPGIYTNSPDFTPPGGYGSPEGRIEAAKTPMGRALSDLKARGIRSEDDYSIYIDEFNKAVKNEYKLDQQARELTPENMPYIKGVTPESPPQNMPFIEGETDPGELINLKDPPSGHMNFKNGGQVTPMGGMKSAFRGDWKLGNKR